ncbi:MAG: hypothetical protein HY867_13525, partial [Chloroflexi bacterium]|nr:hypothetical protein [Chloroflexota bacterium]
MKTSTLTKQVVFAIMIVMLALAVLPVQPAHAAACSWDGSSSTAWATGANWTGCSGGGGVPANIDTITIPSGVPNQPTLGGGGATIAGLTVNSGATLTLGTQTLNVNGPISNAGTITASSGRLTQQTTGDFTNSGTVTFTGNGRIYFAGNVTNTGTLALGSAEVRFYGADAGPFTVAAFSTTGDIDWRKTAGTVTFAGNVSAAQLLMDNGNGEAGTLILGSGNTFTFPTVATISGVAFTNNGTLTVATALSGTGTLTNSSTGTLNLTGGASSITTLANAGIVNMSGASISSTALANFTNTGTVNLNTTGAITGITNNANGTVNLTNSGTITSFNNATSTSTLNISDLTPPTITTLTVTAAGNTVNYNGAGAQTINTVPTYSNLSTGGSGIKTAGGVMNINANLTVGSVTTFSTANSVNIGGNWTVDGTFTQTAATTTFTGGGTHACAGAGAIQFNNLTTSSQTINAGSCDIRIVGNWTHGTAGTFNAQTSTVTFNGGGAQSQPTTAFVPQFYNMTVNKSGGTLSPGRVWTVTNNFLLTLGAFAPASTSSFNNATLNGGTFTAPAGGNLNVSGNWTRNGGTFTAGTGTVTFNGPGAQTIGGSSATAFNNLIFSGSGAKSMGPAGTSVAGNLTITSPATASVGNGLNLSVGSLTLGALGTAPGTWGYAVASPPAYANPTYFANTTGYLTVGTDTRGASTVTVTGTTSFNYNGAPQGPDTSTVTGSSGAVTYSYAGTGGTIYGPSSTKPTNAGTYAVTATVAADGYYSAASSSATPFTINKANQATLTITGPASMTFGDADATITTSGGSGSGAVTFDAGASTACSIVAGNLHVLSGTGTCDITATKAADSNYNSITSASFAVTINKANQAALTITAPASMTFGDADATISYSGGTTGGAVTFDAGASTACSIVAGKLHVVSGTGTCDITATMAGDNDYNPVTSASFAVTINKANQATLTITGPASMAFGDADATITTSGGSGTGAVTFDAGASTACSIVAGNLHVLSGTGTCDITATKAADNDYNSTTSASFAVTISKANQAALTITGPASMTFGDADATITTSGGSGSGAVTFDAGASTACSIVAGKLHVLSGTGTCDITATKAADNDYNSTTSASFAVTISKANQAALTIT